MSAKNKLSTAVLVAASVVGIGYVGAEFVHKDFRYYMLGALLLLWAVAYFVARHMNHKLALALAAMEKEQREEYLRGLDPKQRVQIEKLIESRIQRCDLGSAR